MVVCSTSIMLINRNIGVVDGTSCYPLSNCGAQRKSLSGIDSRGDLVAVRVVGIAFASTVEP